MPTPVGAARSAAGSQIADLRRRSLHLGRADSAGIGPNRSQANGSNRAERMHRQQSRDYVCRYAARPSVWLV